LPSVSSCFHETYRSACSDNICLCKTSSWPSRSTTRLKRSYNTNSRDHLSLADVTGAAGITGARRLRPLASRQYQVGWVEVPRCRYNQQAKPRTFSGG